MACAAFILLYLYSCTLVDALLNMATIWSNPCEPQANCLVSDHYFSTVGSIKYECSCLHLVHSIHIYLLFKPANEGQPITKEEELEQLASVRQVAKALHKGAL